MTRFCSAIKSTIHTSLKIHPQETCALVWSEAASCYLTYFNELFPPSTDVKNKLENCNTFFMTLGLYGLSQEYVNTRHQILGSLVNPAMTTTSSETHTYFVARLKHYLCHNNNYGYSRIYYSKNHPKSEHCHCIGHTIDRCQKLNEKPPSSTQ
ncbi:hypothetical protein PHAVU_006G027600 [Phaseolus vulgaris]|uniref:Uncharacterized protein n=1 Tax=Phaseolus vulgaris TaxID=3885 RepID=V7BNW4_PHAVU|nr:hypothetical protein PHAVU_006G027600g [Phaseolus vulgaris]ESW18276.1 hypothetical protein PHAVU_006G027600g [Phaseolus vulgaris]